MRRVPSKYEMFNSYEQSIVNWQETVVFNEINAVITSNRTHAF